MFLVFFIAWVIFNGKLTVEIAVFGLIFCGLMELFMIKFMDFKMSYELKFYKKFFVTLELIYTLFVEIVKSNTYMLYWIFSDKYEMEPALVSFKCDLKSPLCKFLLATCITLTPGTITGLLEDDVFTIHCLDKELGNDLAESSFVKVLRKYEEI